MTFVRKAAVSGLFVIGSGFAVYQSVKSENNRVFAAWTTNYEGRKPTKWDTNWDRRDPAYLAKPAKGEEVGDIKPENLETFKSKAVRHLFLIRHGQYNLQGATDKEKILTELGKLRLQNLNAIKLLLLGRQQAKLTGERLRELKHPYSLMVRSTMTRAQETGNIILSRLEPGSMAVKDCNMLEEGAPIPPEPPIGGWKPECYFHMDGSRIEAAFRNYFYRADPRQIEDTYELYVCHANVIRYFICRAMQFPPEAWLRISLNHASITWLSIMPSGRVILRSVGDTGHMPPECITSA